MMKRVGAISYFECGQCGRHLPADWTRNCECGGNVLARYDLAGLREAWNRDDLDRAGMDMWRYLPVLPVANEASVVSLGEGWTPLIRARRLEASLGLENIWIKDEGGNPACSWECRAAACSVSAAVEARQASVFGHGSGAVAAAAYAAAAGLECWVEEIDAAQESECRTFGAKLGPVGEPTGIYRVEGLKTVAYEIAEQFDWAPPAVVICPADGVAAMEKGFAELESLGWLSGAVPRVIGPAQAAFRKALESAAELARLQGISAGPETGACLLALAPADGATVVVNAESGFRSREAFARLFPSSRAAETDKLGGLITPR